MLLIAGGLVAGLSGVAAAHTGPALVAHMVEHIGLLSVAPLLLALGFPVGRNIARRAEPWFVAFAAALSVHAATLLLWHVPPAFDAAVRSAPVHSVEHLTMLASGYVFWSLLFARPDARALRAPLLFVASLPGIALGMAMMLSSHSWYATSPDALADQQLAGVVMLALGGAVYAGAALVGVMRWVSSLTGEEAVAK